jgi:ABC-2 type transport system permease protein
MKALLAIAAAEWRCWLRAKLALLGALAMAVLLVATTVLTHGRTQEARAERAQSQAQAEAAFWEQPDRHPHRMVHYGHYVFRAPAPLALLDPGLDAVTGQSIFLEGHRQNTAMFAAAGASADLGALSWLSPALVYQLFGPLLLILLGHATLVREREAGTLATLLAQGTPGRLLLAGKALALGAWLLLMLLPLALGALLAQHQGEPAASAWALVGVYGLYLSVWAALTLIASALFQRRSAVLVALVALWIALNLVLPALAANAAAQTASGLGKLETDLKMLTELRKLGDGHNANDPAFARLRADLLAQYKVERPEDLPVNLRGVVAQYAEAKLTRTLNDYAERQMRAETAQAQALARWGWLTPALAVAEASRAVAGTDLVHHHRFLREAEALRYDFVQSLNRLHTEALAYSDDIRRSSDAAAERRTRVDAGHWQLLRRFEFRPDAAEARIAQARGPLHMLLLWFGLLLLVGLWLGGRLKP